MPLSPEEWDETFNEDGSAKDPVAFREKIKNDPEALADIEKDKELAQALLGGDTAMMQETLKKMHIMSKRQENLRSSSTMQSNDILRAGCTVPRDVTVLYEQMLQAGLQYGPAFRLLEKVWIPEETAKKQAEMQAAQS